MDRWMVGCVCLRMLLLPRLLAQDYDNCSLTMKLIDLWNRNENERKKNYKKEREAKRIENGRVESEGEIEREEKYRETDCCTSSLP